MGSVGSLAGRDAELAVLERTLDALDDGGSHALGVWGEPGIGKSRLLGELRDRAAARGHLVLAGRAAELERDVPFALWGDALDGHGDVLEARRSRPSRSRRTSAATGAQASGGRSSRRSQAPA
jgi:predicted ATPase